MRSVGQLPDYVTLSLFQCPWPDVRWMLKQVQHDNGEE